MLIERNNIKYYKPSTIIELLEVTSKTLYNYLKELEYKGKIKHGYHYITVVSGRHYSMECLDLFRELKEQKKNKMSQMMSDYHKAKRRKIK